MIWRSLMLASLSGVAYVLAGYPMAIIGLARILPGERKAEPMTDDELPTVTVVVAAYNEESVIEGRILNLLESDYPADKLEVLVVADGSDDATAPIARSVKDSRVTVVAAGQRKGKSAALSRIFPLIGSDVVVFSDANNAYERDGLRRLVTHFAHSAVGAVTGAKRVLPDEGTVGAGEGLYWRYESAIKESESRTGSCVAVVGEMLAIRTHLLEPIPAAVINDDFYLAMAVLRSGSNIVYEPGAISWEPATSTSAGDRLRRERIVAGRVQAIAMAPQILPWKRPLETWKVVSHKLMRPLVPALAAVALGSTVLAAATSTRSRRDAVLPWTMLVGQGAFYTVAAIGERSANPGRLPRIAAYLVDSHRSSLIGAVSYLKGERTAVWEKADRSTGQSGHS